MATSPGFNNTFVPKLEATGQLQIDYSRNTDSFPLNKYVKIIPVDKAKGFYLSFTNEESARITETNMARHIWQDGAEAPDNLHEREFAFNAYECLRYLDSWALGWMGRDQADFDVSSAYVRSAAARMMTGRATQVMTVLTTAGNWGSNTASATTAGGGKWDVSGTNDLFIKKSILASVEAINKATNGVARSQDLVLIVSPTGAKEMATGKDATDSELHSFLAQSFVAFDAQQGIGLDNYGLPSRLYGVEVVVEDTVRVSSNNGATRSDGYLIDDDAVIVLRNGGLVGGRNATDGEPSAISLFMYEEMTLEQLDDPNNRRTVGRVVETYDTVLTSSAGGYLVTDIYDQTYLIKAIYLLIKTLGFFLGFFICFADYYISEITLQIIQKGIKCIKIQQQND